MTIKREELEDVISINYMTRDRNEIIHLEENQVFMQTEKCIELWQVEPLCLLKRWRRKFVYWVGIKEVG